MAIAIPGITNENSFFSEHYLATLFERHRREWERQVDFTSRETASHRQLQGLFLRSRHALMNEQQGQFLAHDAGEFQHALLDALGYDRRVTREVVKFQGQSVGIPVLARVGRGEEADALWILEVRETVGNDQWGQDPLALSYDPELYISSELIFPSKDTSVREVIDGGILSEHRPPRWIMVLTLAQIVLVDRYKWSDERLLRFDLETVLTQPHATCWRSMRALLHKDSLVPQGGVRGMERFDEESRHHAHGVSADLKYAMREAVEVLGNAAVDKLISQRRLQRRAIWEGPNGIDAEQLTKECLRYMYRLLFLLFAEAQPHLGHSFLRSLVFQNGYSLENLRNVEFKQISEDEESYFLHESLKTLFRFFHKGTTYRDTDVLRDPTGILKHDFVVEPVGAELFESSQTPLLESIRIPDSAWRRIIELLSLSRPSKHGRGRISYAQLGVNQLGEVYEALLSYAGFFARENLVEVKRAQDDAPDVLDRAWFVPQSQIENYMPEEIVYDGNLPKIVPRGTFIYRLTGFARKETASYYTPESLTTSTVRYALDASFKDAAADQILSLRICEPAMGSAAFLIEAVNQLADRYLQKKQQELSEVIPANDLPRERQRVRAYITARNAFGVDINPEALELGEVSLWLNCMEPSGFRPDFSRTLHNGNSLLGAGCKVISFQESESLIYMSQVETRPMKGRLHDRNSNEIYHFLLPLAEMVQIKGRDVNDLLPEATAQIRDWVRETKRPYRAEEYEVLQCLSVVVDLLFVAVLEKRAAWRAEYEAMIPAVYGQNPVAERPKSSLLWHCEEFERLQMAMDYWSSLWFWPLEKLEVLPNREQFLEEMSLILTGTRADVSGTVNWVGRADLEDIRERSLQTLLEPTGNHIDLSGLTEAMPTRIPIVKEVCVRERFFHWDLELADILLQDRGFDLIVGNPPWVKLDWTEKDPLEQFEPQIFIRDMRAVEIRRLKPDILNTAERKSEFLEHYRHANAFAAYCQHSLNYQALSGIQPNTYKVFLARAFELIGKLGAIGYIHPVDHLNDPKGSSFREVCYRRKEWLFQFANERSRHLFVDIDHHTTFAIGIYSGMERKPHFGMIANLYDPLTIRECLNHDGAGPIPGIKDANGNWQLKGHRSRVIIVNNFTLGRLGAILDPEVHPDQVRLPMLHSRELADTLIKITQVPRRLGDLKGEYVQDAMWHETNDGKTPDPVFRRETAFYGVPEHIILSGPIFSLGNPLAKCPRPRCKHNQDYDVIDLTAIPDDYLPRANYTPVIPWDEYRSKVRSVPWDKGTKHIDCNRIIVRRRVGAASDRTLQCAIVPEGFAHVNVCESLSFESLQTLISICSLWSSLPYDFITKSFQVTDIFSSFTSRLPDVSLPSTALHRTLQLNCLTEFYAPLWKALNSSLSPLGWSGDHPSLNLEGENYAAQNWDRTCALRSDYARRQAFLEIDVIVAMALDLSLEELLQIYRLVFPVMRSYEGNTWYDQKGRIVWSNRLGKGLKESRKDWESHREMKCGVLPEVIEDNTMPSGPLTRTIEYVAPFTKPNLEEDYRQAWQYFEKHL